MTGAFERGDLAAAREEQFRSVLIIKLLAIFGYLGAAEAVMEMLGVPVGPPRLPNGELTTERIRDLRRQLEELGFFAWIAPCP